MNNWNIPSLLEAEVRKRDLFCIYCNVKFDKNIKKNTATWEHIVNNAKIVTRENIALCCCSCNSSKGAKDVSIWLTSDYCKRKNINPENVALVVREALTNPPTV